MRAFISIPLFVVAASAAVMKSLDSREVCKFSRCTTRLAGLGVGCAGKGLLGIAGCAAGLASFAANSIDCAGCFDRPEACSINGLSCPAVGTSYPKCLDHCAENVHTGRNKVECPVFCINQCGC